MSPNLPLSSSRTNIFVLILFLFLGTIAYWNSMSVPFQFDDYHTVLKNPEVRNLDSFFKEFSYLEISRPFLFFTFALNYKLSGLNVLGYHIVNLILHVLTAFVLYLILAKTIASEPEGASSGLYIFPVISSLIFLVHPLATESVTYISSRSSVLSAFFYLSGIFIFIKADNARKKISLYTILLLVSYLLSIGSKEISVTFPAIILLYDFYFLSKGELKKIKEKFSFFYLPLLLITILLLLFKFSYGLTLSSPDKTARGLFSHILSEIPASIYSLKQFFIPTALNIDPDFRLISSPLDYSFAISLAILIILLWISKTLYHRSHSKLISFSILWFFTTLSPHYLIRLQDIMSERWLYLSLVSLSFLITGLGLEISSLDKKKIRKAFFIVSFVVIVTFSILTINRNNAYQSELSLWEDTVKKSPLKPRPHLDLGVMYDEKGLYGKAEKEYLKAIELNGDYAEAFHNLGIIYLRRKEDDKALEVLTRAITIKPDYGEAYNTLAILYSDKGDLSKAETLLLKAITFNKNYAVAYSNLGHILFNRGERKEAIVLYQKAISLDPDLPIREELERLIRKYR